MLPMRILRTCYTCRLKTLSCRSMTIVTSKTNVIPEDIQKLSKELNLNNEELAKVFNNHQNKLRYSKKQWLKFFDYLSQYDFKKSQILEMIDSNPDLLRVNNSNLHKCMSVWTNLRFDDQKLKQLIVNQPCCLLLDDKDLLSRIPKLLAYVGNKRNWLLELISYSPNVLFDSWTHLEAKLDYVMLNMEFGPTQFVTTNVMSSKLFDIKCRHSFLVKLGMFKPRDPKAEKSNQITGNPSLKRIMETNDKQFAVKVAGVTTEEFVVYKKIFEKQFDENEDDSDQEEFNLD
ncbi:Transcription termination factor, mitochondrial/chloroplastic [Cinara cedri]|uniref:Transcription termination factor, mitochondrial/chloroplastic n=1 Tax=Cinara cedri TaxID=506608 RepID=A0A5E4MEU0_9HEMI|nr:Transcription termination factor, mitochondrial/chloroplastic [Cinara cedri]